MKQYHIQKYAIIEDKGKLAKTVMRNYGGTHCMNCILRYYGTACFEDFPFTCSDHIFPGEPSMKFVKIDGIIE